MKKQKIKPNTDMPSDEDLKALAGFRSALRRFLAFSEQAAAARGITMQWYQAMLVIRTQNANARVSIGELAESLMIRDHSATELVARLTSANLVKRHDDPKDGRRSFLSLSAQGEKCLADLAQTHLMRLKENQDAFLNLFEANRSLQRLEEVEKENETLRRIVADLSIANRKLSELETRKRGRRPAPIEHLADT